MTRATEGWVNYEDLIGEADVRLRDLAIGSLGHQTMRRWIEEANREFARMSNSVRDDYFTVLIADQAEYQLPEDSLKVDLVSVRYPGETYDWLLVPYTLQEAVEEGYDNQSGRPSRWYLTHDRRKIGFVFVPDAGGVKGLTTGLAGDALTIVDSALSTTDDAYNGLTVRITSGAQEGQERTISDYDAATTTITVDSAFAAAIASGVHYEIHPDSLKIRYSKMGNSYKVQPTNAAVEAAPVPTRSTFGLNLPDRTPNYYKGCEVRFTSGALKGERTRIISDTSTAAPIATVTVEPELFIEPTAADTCVVTDVPNIPGSFHHSLVDYVVFLALDRAGNPQALTHLSRFREMAGQSMAADHPEQGQVFHRVRESRWGDEGWEF